MVENLRLYINDKLVEFSTDPKVLYTYQASDVTNPTAVKNSFTKTVTIDGTPSNNDIFGHYWNVERYLLNGGEGGVYFNSSKKAPFQLFIGSTLYEDGYAKLDSIQRNGGDLKYNVTLYGALGDFFYNLSTAENGEEKKLSDLDYTDEGGADEFNFTANIDSVYTAWGVLGGTVNPNFSNNKKWKHINFMPAYNGLPSDFDADKVIINSSGTTLQYGAKNADDDQWYYMKNRWTIGTLPQEMTEWEVRDLRSYLQRPCIKMSSIVSACCNPDCNGGYNVVLDEDFFNDENPYWTKTWLSLPMVQNLEYSNEEQILDGATLLTATTSGETNGLMYQDLRFDLGEINGNVSNITVKCNIFSQVGQGCTSYIWFWNWNGDSAHPGWICFGSLFCQLIALNGDTVVGASPAYNLTTPVRHNGNLYYGHNGHYPESTGIDSSTGRRKMGDGTQFIPYMDMPIYNVLGKLSPTGFKKEISHTSSGSTYSNTPYEFTFSIDNIGTNVTGLKMVYYWGASEKKVKHFGPNWVFGSPYHDAWVSNEYSAESVRVTDNNMNITSHNLSAVLGESLGRTGTKVTKALLLNTESTPCDYLLSYCKMFGLHFTKEIGSKTINIMTRKSFYKRNNIVDLNEYIDHGKQIDITPIMFKSKWYQFLQEKDETELQQKYLTAKGVEYGCKVLDTGYQFSSEKQDLLKDNCIKSGIEALEKSKWFIAYNNDESLRPWMKVGLKYTLWNGTDEMEYNAGVGNSGTVIPINEGDGMKYYDIFPKLQFHDGDNGATDGNNCLVFFSGFKSVLSGRTNPLSYILSDDTVYQTDLNEGTPCWLFTKYDVVNGKRLCYKLNKIPVFERYLTSDNSGTISKSLDFGSAQELYVPNYNLTDDTNIYYNFWRSYLTDLFDVNTKQMTCYVKINENPNTEWLRRFYWFDNAIWMANKVSDWNPASYETTKVEFIKVQDVNNYSSITQGNPKTIELSADTYNVSYAGGNVTLTITVESGARWRLTQSGGASVTLSATGGTGPGTVTATFAGNSEDYPVGTYFRATRIDNAADASLYVSQGFEGQQSVSASPEDIIVPATGGSVTIDFTWFNQGGAYIDFVDYNESSDCLQFTVDTDTYKSENKAILTFSANTGTTVLHNYCTFYSYSADCNTTIGIDQLPASYAFDGSGNTVTIPVQYATGGTFSDVPYWVTTVDNVDGTYSLIAEENTLSTGRTSVVRLSVDGTSAQFTVTQGEGAGGSGLVTPSALVFDATGGTQTVTVRIPNAWTVAAKSPWVTLGGVTGGTGTTTVSVTAIPYSGSEQRTGIIIFYDTVTQNTGSVTLVQNAADGELLAVSPSSLRFNAGGGEANITIIANTDWTIG